MDDEIIIGITPQKNKLTKGKNNRATKKVASKKNTNKDKKKKIQKTLLIFFIFLFLILCFTFLLFSSFFSIEKIEIKNNNRVNSEEIKTLGDFESYINLFWVNNLSVKKDLEQNPYIEDVKIHKKIPNTLIIDIKERIPKFMLQIGDSYIYINNQGYLLEVSTENIGLPIILGFKTDLSNVVVR
ncbi:MAG: FtsQ-type POTRA domain-containing protein [Clostridia bacterium]|nr:FtsQ-type POTRA domain-containing protein [Clostridia bacterium]